MVIFYSICAVLGCTILVCQSVLTVTGLGHADDIDDGGHGFDGDHGDMAHGQHDGHATHGAHGTNWFFGVITLRTMTAALAFFGLTGLAVSASENPPIPTFVAATAAGAAAMFFVHWLMRSLAHLRAEGTTRIEKAVGVIGSVYIKIPGRRAGPGKVHISLQNRTVELSAVTEHDTLPTGARIVVTKVVGPDAVEVAPAETAA